MQNWFLDEAAPHLVLERESFGGSFNKLEVLAFKAERGQACLQPSIVDFCLSGHCGGQHVGREAQGVAGIGGGYQEGDREMLLG
jgi:hypothetical protein